MKSEANKAKGIVISNIIERHPGELKPWPRNPRFHPEKQLTLLAANIRQVGMTMPVLIDEDSVILSGHGRVQAAIRLGLTNVPTRAISGLSLSQKRSYVISDNKIGLLSSWDTNLLKAEMEILIEEDFNIELTCFSTAEIDLLLEDQTSKSSSSKNNVDDLQADDFTIDIVSRLGDLWRLGNHYLLCENSLRWDSYQEVMQGMNAQMVITDPPYNVKISGHVCGNGKVQHKEFFMASGEMTQEQFVEFLRDACQNIKRASQDGAVIYIFMDWRHIRELQDAAVPLFGPPRQMCVWDKGTGGMGTFYRSQHELVFVFRKGDAPHINNFELGQHGRYRTNVWAYPGANTFGSEGKELSKSHPTVKSVSLIADAIRDCSHRNGIVLDPFCGSGTILIAAERTGRHARAIEIDPAYVDVAVNRWQRVTGRQATLASTGQTWDQVRDERLSTSVMGGNHGL
jgi:DNA modification methylase